MKTLHFDVHIQAPAEKVWSTLWSDATYRQWTSGFAPGSHIESNWEEGSPIRFMDAAGNGVYSIIHKKIPNHHISFINLGELFEGREQVVDERTSAIEWSGAMENYWLNEKKGATSLWVEMEVNKRDAGLFAEKFPGALEKIKALAEGAPSPAIPFQMAPPDYELKLAV